MTIANKNRLPTLGAPSFTCPYCSATAHQFWFNLFALNCDDRSRPSIPDDQSIEMLAKAKTNSDDERKRIQNAVERGRLLQLGKLFVWEGTCPRYEVLYVGNLWLSRCYSCGEMCVWLHDKMINPIAAYDVKPNEDMPADVRNDFLEAASILNNSPRGSAALLRLAIQRLCKHLGGKGKNINEDVAALVAKGLNPLIGKALDIVRVIGNEAVHPGQIDLRDDKETAGRLFHIVNVVCEQMISNHRHIDELYALLPEAARQGIGRRDSKSLAKLSPDGEIEPNSTA